MGREKWNPISKVWYTLVLFMLSQSSKFNIVFVEVTDNYISFFLCVPCAQYISETNFGFKKKKKKRF